MDRSLVQTKQKRSGADATAMIVQATMKTAVRVCCTGPVRRASGHLRTCRARREAQFRAVSVGSPPCSMDRVASAWRDKADPIAALMSSVCPRESDATADRVGNRLHRLP